MAGTGTAVIHRDIKIIPKADRHLSDYLRLTVIVESRWRAAMKGARELIEQKYQREGTYRRIAPSV
jgi:hypothetical protein